MYHFLLIRNCLLYSPLIISLLTADVGPVISTKLFAEILLWFIYSFNLLGFVFQIRTNYRLRTTKGVSFWLVWTYHIANITSLLFVYLLWLPLPLRVMVPIETLIIATLVTQELCYSRDELFRHRVAVLHGSILVAGLCMWAASWWYPEHIGHLAGWIGFCVLSISQIPQIVRNWRRQSVVGYSGLYLACSTIATILHLWIVYILKLPLQSYGNSIRALLMRVVLWWQYFTYQKRNAIPSFRA